MCEDDPWESCNKNRKIILSILYIILIGFFTPSLVYSILILNNSSENPLEKEEYSDKNNYFKNIAILGDNLVDCEKIQESIMVQNLSLIDIFELNTNSIYSNSKALISLNCIIFFFCIIIYCSNNCLFSIVCCCLNEKGTRECFGGCFADYLASAILIILNLICLIADSIIFGILCRKFDNGGTKNFLSFLECKNVNKDAFEKYLVLEDLDSYFSFLKIFQSLFIVYVFIYSLFAVIGKCCLFGDVEEKDNKLL